MNCGWQSRRSPAMRADPAPQSLRARLERASARDAQALRERFGLLAPVDFRESSLDLACGADVCELEQLPVEFGGIERETP